MKIKVMFFGILTDVVKRNMLEISDTKTLGGLEKHLKEKYPELQRYIYRVFVNRELVSGSKSLKDGDEVAMLPPFAGG